MVAQAPVSALTGLVFACIVRWHFNPGEERELVGELGNHLREARENRGLTLEQVEDATRIRRAFLEALEAEQFDKLPPDVCARGFLRNYARFLGLDPDPLLKAYRSPQSRTTLRLPAVLDEPLRNSAVRNIWTALFWGLVVVVILGLGLWYGYNEFYLGTAWGPRPTPSVIPVETLPLETATVAVVAAENQPTATSMPVATVDSSQATATTQPSATGSPMASQTSTRGGTATATRSAGLSSSPTRTPTASTPAARTPTVTAGIAATPSSGPTRATPPLEDGIPVVLHVSDKTYVNVLVDGTKVMEAILEQGDDQAWAFKRTFSIRVGNAGGAQITLNGVDLPPLGKAGQVITVEYSADNLPVN